MRFLIISDLIHKAYEDEILTYGPYIKEINLWLNHVDEVEIVAPVVYKEPNAIDLSYKHTKIYLNSVPSLNLLTWANRIRTLFFLPYVLSKLFFAMQRADHIHLRCPNNMGLLGAMVQVFFPQKKKTAKYANNWDPSHPQPWTYKLQRKILSHEQLTKNIDVLVYGEWKNQSKNIKSFFTATYHEDEKQELLPRKLDDIIKLIYIGHMGINKRPMLCVEVAKKLIELGYEVKLDMFGEGPEMQILEEFIESWSLQDAITLHGNRNSDVVKEYIGNANFLILASMSEGWPKVIAESMFWGCVPLTTDVSCVNYMIGDGSRGSIIEPRQDDVVAKIINYIDNPSLYEEASIKGLQWSQQYTLERFEAEIGKLL